MSWRLQSPSSWLDNPDVRFVMTPTCRKHESYDQESFVPPRRLPAATLRSTASRYLLAGTDRGSEL